PVVELRPRSVHVVESSVRERGQIAPSEMKVRVERLAVDVPGAAAPRGIPEIDSGQARRNIAADHPDDRRKDIDEGGRTRLAARFDAAGRLDEERNADRLAVEENPVLVLAVLAQSLAVVGEEDDERPLVEAFRFQEGDERADDRVRRRDLS